MFHDQFPLDVDLTILKFAQPRELVVLESVSGCFARFLRHTDRDIDLWWHLWTWNWRWIFPSIPTTSSFKQVVIELACKPNNGVLLLGT